jgi:hypothetical protein
MHKWTQSELEAGTMTLEFSMMRSKSSKCRNMSRDIVMTTEYAFNNIIVEYRSYSFDFLYDFRGTPARRNHFK